MRQKFCPKCGKTVENIYDNLCKDCYLEKHSVVESLPDMIRVQCCSDCRKYILDGEPTFELVGIVEKKLNPFLKKSLVKEWFIQKKQNYVNLTLILRTEGLKRTESKMLRLVFDETLCKYCSWKRGGRFEAVLQLRFPERLRVELKDLVKEAISTANLYDPKAFVTEIEEFGNRINFRMGSKQVAEAIARRIKKKFNSRIRKSEELVGTKRGKRLYRLAIAVIIE